MSINNSLIRDFRNLDLRTIPPAPQPRRRTRMNHKYSTSTSTGIVCLFQPHPIPQDYKCLFSNFDGNAQYRTGTATTTLRYVTFTDTNRRGIILGTATNRLVVPPESTVSFTPAISEHYNLVHVVVTPKPSVGNGPNS